MTPKFPTITAAVRAFSRKRTPQEFIVTSPERMTCEGCGEAIVNRSNRCTYNPKTGQTIALHYDCAWNVTMSDLWAHADKESAAL